jgi:high-affinity Fe2+/Pb2+ permease
MATQEVHSILCSQHTTNAVYGPLKMSAVFWCCLFAVQAMEKAKASSEDTSPQRKHAWSVLILAASAVLREGIESVIFLAGEQ